MQPSVTLDPQPRFTGELRHASLWESFRIQLRVIGALLMREILTRFGRHNIGFMWMFAEPMIFTLGVTALWAIMMVHKGDGSISITEFALTGYSAILLWRNVPSRCVNALLPNGSLMYHRQVLPIDVYIARIILEGLGATMSLVALTFAFWSFGLVSPPQDYLKAFAGWMLLFWFAAAVSLLIGALSERSELVEKLWHPAMYLMIPLSGALFMVGYLPQALQKWVLLLPTVHCTEMFRAGFLGSGHVWIYDIGYVVMFNMGLTLLALLQVRHVTRTLVLDY
jgi:ABC-type polysaccharide/polyol phosphate export permease